MKLSDKIFFTRQLAVMLKGGVPIAEALSTLEVAQTGKLKEVAGELLAEVTAGKSLSAAIEEHPSVFGKLYASLVAVGERSGSLEANLENLADYLEKTYALRKKIFSAMIYPAIVFFLALLIGLGMGTFVLPKFGELFAEIARYGETPLPTRILISFADLFRDRGLFISFLTIFSIFSLAFFFRLPFSQPFSQRIIWYLPVFGPLYRKLVLARFFRSLGILLRSGVYVGEALELLGEVEENLEFRSFAQEAKREVDKGKLFSKIFALSPQLFPPTTLQMIITGEESGKIDEIMFYLANFYEQEVDSSAKNLTTTLEPILVIAVGTVVFFVAAAVILPIYNLASQIR